MHTTEVSFIYSNILHVSATHTSIFREAKKMIKNEMLIQLFKWQNQSNIQNDSAYRWQKHAETISLVCILLVALLHYVYVIIGLYKNLT